MTKDKIFISHRREAQTFRWSELDQSQKKAYNSTIQLLSEYSAKAQLSLKKDNSIIQRDHRAQIIFIDGKRGTGKTSVLTTLIYTTENENRWNAFKQEFISGLFPDQNLQNIVYSQQLGSIKWLKILDLEMLPEPTNLLASLCVRIEEEFKNCVNTPFYTSQLIEKKQRDAWRSFSDLMHDFALGWKTNLQARKEMDPDTYSSEVLRVERARLQLNNFSEVLANLSDFYKNAYNLSHRPIFVLPVDDADLNPQRLLDLLDLSRRAKAPNLVFLVLGNYDNIGQLLEWKYATEISEILPTKEIVSMTGKYVTQMEEYSTHWAYSALQKLVPPGNHLIELEPYTFDEAAKHKSEGCEYNLQQLLQMTLFPKPSGIIKDYLSPHENIWDLITLEKWKNNSHFDSQLISVLSGPIRAIENLSRETVEFLNNLPDTPIRLKGDHLLTFLKLYFKKAFEGALAAEPGLPYWVRQRLKTLFYQLGPIPDPRQTEKSVEVHPTRLPIQHDASDQFSGLSNHCVYLFRKCDGFSLRIPGPTNYPMEPNKKQNNKEFHNLNDWRANWIFLNHDINLLYPASTIERMDFSSCSQYWASSGEYFPRLADEQLLISWPAPNWLLFNHLEMFRIYWNSILEHNHFEEPHFETKTHGGAPSKRNYHLEFAAYLWSKSINDIIQKEQLDLSVTLLQYIENGHDLWKKMIVSMNLFLKKTDGVSGLRKRYMSEWISLFLILFTPELGIFKKNPLIKSSRATSAKDELTNLIRAVDSSFLYLRVNKISRAINSRNAEVAFELISLTSHWFEKDSPVKLKQVLREVFKHPDTHNLSTEQRRLWAELLREITSDETADLEKTITLNMPVVEEKSDGEAKPKRSTTASRKLQPQVTTAKATPGATVTPPKEEKPKTTRTTTSKAASRKASPKSRKNDKV